MLKFILILCILLKYSNAREIELTSGWNNDWHVTFELNEDVKPKQIIMDEVNNYTLITESDIQRNPNCVNVFCCLFEITWSGDAEIFSQYYGSQFFSSQNKTWNTIIVSDKNDTRGIYWDELSTIKPNSSYCTTDQNIRVYYSFDRTSWTWECESYHENCALNISDTNLDFSWSLNFTFKKVKDVGLGQLDQEYIENVRLRNGVICGIDTFSLLFSVFLIMKKSTKEMKTYKWFLLNIAIWSYLVDFNLTMIFMPIGLFPAPAIAAVGWLLPINSTSFFSTYFMPAIATFLFVFTITGCGTALVCAIYYRYRLLTNPNMVLQTRRWFLPTAFLHLISCFPITIPGYFVMLTLESTLQRNIAKYKYFVSLTQTILLFSLDMENMETKIFISALALTLLFYTSFAIGMSNYMLHKWRKIAKNRVSKDGNQAKKFHSAQRNLIISIIIQSSVPISLLVLPYGFMVSSVVFDINHVIDMSTILQEFSTLHSTFNMLVMALSIKPYRKAIAKMLKLKWRNSVGILHAG